ncbi:MAG TPA: phosphoribosylaminoimidazolesuccinocarboxamide synthase [Bacteroidota bacterium]|nr:phosphoribosylaminoimidazolesuccinocarboxamide synthase [Bacteroidota bacterium]
MKAQAQSLLLEGKENVAETVRKEIFAGQPGRNLYRTNKRDLLIQEFTMPVPSNGKNRNGPADSRVLRNEISSYLFEYLRGFHVPTHYVGPRPGAEMLVKFADPIPLIVRVFNVPEAGWSDRFGTAATERLEFPVIEHYLAGNGAALTWINEYHLYAFNLVKPEEFRQVNRLASKVNAVLRGLCERRELALGDTGMTFGRYNNQVILTGELSPVTCRFLEASPVNRKGNGTYTPVETGSDEAFGSLCARLKLNG